MTVKLKAADARMSAGSDDAGASERIGGARRVEGELQAERIAGSVRLLLKCELWMPRSMLSSCW